MLFRSLAGENDASNLGLGIIVPVSVGVRLGIEAIVSNEAGIIFIDDGAIDGVGVAVLEIDKIVDRLRRFVLGPTTKLRGRGTWTRSSCNVAADVGG